MASPRSSDPVYDDEFAVPVDRRAAFADFLAIVKQLRRDCPWDRAQTHESVKHLLIEEAYEVVEAITEEDGEELAEELGDVFLHVLFHSVIAEEEGHFSVADVIEAETDKLVRRHPHVFGDETADDPDAVAASWEEIKQREDDGDDPSSVLDGVPTQLPALLRAYRSQEKAAGVGFEFPDADAAWEKVEEELAEFRAAAQQADQDEQEAEFGDLLFALTNYAREVGINPETALQETNATFTRRVRHVEDRLRARDASLEEIELDTAEALWNEAKEEGD